MCAQPVAPKSVVIIDDDPSVQCVLREALESAGLAVEAFTSPFLALASIRRSIPDVVVLDWHMAEANGAVVLERLRYTFDQKPRVLVLTGDVRLKVSPELADLMRKPVSLMNFVERVSALASMSPPEVQTRSA
jgi:DNA-binding response OmpR family regulator